MPELPEVETVRQELYTHILNKKLIHIQVLTPGILRQPKERFVRHLSGQSFVDITRAGKQLRFHVSDGMMMLAHLKMTGQFLYKEHNQLKAGIFPLLYASVPGGKTLAGHFKDDQYTRAQQPKHTHVIFEFEDASQLSFRDQRRFGYLDIISAEAVKALDDRMGIDPLSEKWTLENFYEMFKNRKKSIKALLMDQQVIAGIGNIYADEICHRVGIRPLRSVSTISKKTIETLFQSTTQVIEEAVFRKGTTLRDYTRPDGSEGENAFHLQVYGRSGQKCLRCDSAKIQKVTYLGRGTHFCPKCQR